MRRDPVLDETCPAFITIMDSSLSKPLFALAGCILSSRIAPVGKLAASGGVLYAYEITLLYLALHATHKDANATRGRFN